MNILITGASRGLGRGFVETYLKRSDVSKVWAVSRNTDRLQDLARQYGKKLELVSATVSEEQAKGKLFSVLGNETLDLLINVAGVYPEEPSSFLEISPKSLHEGYEGNVYSAFLTTQACVAALKRSNQAKVVSITSLMGSIADNTSGGSYAYRMSKAALNMFNKCFSIEFPKFTAVVLHPGWVKTDMGGDQAPTTVDESIQGMVKVISELTPKQTGQFFDFEGDRIEW